MTISPAHIASRAEPIPACIDFHGVAALIDTVAGVAPRRLGRLLHVLWSSDERLEARVVVEIVLRCRDPLAPLSTLCRDALKTARDLDTLLKAPPWRHVEEVCRSVRASALLNLCDAILAEPTPYNAKRRGRIREIRPRVKVEAAGELNSRQADVERIRAAREVALPDLWSLLATYLAKDSRVPAFSLPTSTDDGDCGANPRGRRRNRAPAGRA